MNTQSPRPSAAQSRWSATAGFTLAEIILVVAVLAILTSMMAPPVMNFMRQRDIREEQNMQVEVRKAMENMLTNTGQLPSDTATGTSAWYNQLTRYTNLGPSQIRLDVWGNERRYIMYSNSEKMLNTDIPIYYATVLSRGPDRSATSQTDSTIGSLVPVSTATGGNDFAAASNTGWWKSRTDKAAAFSAVAVSSTSDDILLRFTDFSGKIGAYNKTLERMGKLAEALESYSRILYAERVVYCSTDGSTHVTGNPSGTVNCVDYPPERQIHYPRGWNSGITTDSANNYNQSVLTAMSNQTGGSANYVDDGSDDATRRTAMINLMRILGLPDEYCCSALDYYTNASGTRLEKPFFYFSNPRPRMADGTSCGSRRGISSGSTLPSLPVRLTTLNVDDGTAGATCG